MRAGGAATAGGMNYQAAVTALIAVHVATGKQLSWADDLLPHPPISVSAETGGSGDDIRVCFEDGTRAEMQVKKGLKRGDKLWSALENLARGIAKNLKEVGVLVVCENSSGPVKNDLRKDIERIGDGRDDGLKDISTEFKARVEKLGFSPKTICSRLRIAVVDATEINSTHIQLALRDIETICAEQNAARGAWNALCADSARLIETRGNRDIVSIGRTLRGAKISIRQYESKPAAIIAALGNFVIDSNSQITIPGYLEPLPIDDVWISTSVKTWTFTSQPEGSNYSNALAQYHRSIEADHSESTFDIEWLGRFVRHVVVVGGPGAGKSTAAKVLARRYGLDGFPVLKVRLSQIAQRLAHGDGLWDALLSVGLDGAGINAIQLGMHFPWVIVADGLDECGPQKSEISERLANLARSHPHFRIIITTRPIGYDAPFLGNWRHYQMLAQDDTAAGNALCRLTEYLSEGKVKLEGRLGGLEDIDRDLSEAIRRTPLVLALSAVLIAEGQPIAKTRAGQYRAIFKRMEETNASRANNGGLSEPVLRRILNAIGEHVIANPLVTTNQTMAFAASDLCVALNLNKLQAEDQVQKALSYWKEIGLLEEVTYNDDSYLTFIHRTFAEFASARYMVETITEPEAIDGAVRCRIDDEKWMEVVEFAGYLEWGDAIIRHLLSNFSVTSIGAESVAQALKIVTSSDKVLTSTERTALFDCALKLGETGRRDIVSIISKQLLRATGRHPLEGHDLGKELSESEESWARLLGWALLLGGDRSQSSVNDAQADFPVLADVILNDRDRDTTGIINLDRSPNRLIEAFSIRLIDALAIGLDADALAEAVSPIVELRDELSWRFNTAIQQCLQRHQIVDRFQKSSFETSLNTAGSAKLWSDNFRNMLLEMFSPILGLLTVEQRGNVASSTDVTHLQMSAILQVSEFWHMSLSDIFGADNDDLKAAEQEVMRGLLEATGLELDVLASEILAFKQAIDQQPDADFQLFDKTVHVDCELPTWSVQTNPPLDCQKLSKSVRESSHWIACVATELIQANADETELETIVEYALEHKTYSSLSLGSHLAKKLPHSKAHAVLLETATDYNNDVSPVLSSLTSLASWDKKVIEVTKLHLLGKNVENAIGAAKLMFSLAPRHDTEVIELARQAYEHWQENEEPYPEKGGTVPRSPRDKLVEMIDVSNWGDQKLFNAARDPRSDVRNWGVTALVEKLAGQALLQTKFVERCIAEKFPHETLRSILNKNPRLDQNRAITLAEHLLCHEDKRWRYIGLGVLEFECINDQQKDDLIGKLADNQPTEIVARIERLRAQANLHS